jgi:hypothetical protein
MRVRAWDQAATASSARAWAARLSPRSAWVMWRRASGLAVDVAEAAGEGSFDEVDAVVGLFEAEGLVGEGAHHPGGVAVRVGFAGELVADLVVALCGAFLAEVVVFPACRSEG